MIKKKLKFIGLLTVCILIFSVGCKKEQTNVEVNPDNYEYYGKYHNKYIKNILSKSSNKSTINLENIYQDLVEQVATDFNINQSELPTYEYLLQEVQNYVDSSRTLQNVINDERFSIMDTEKEYFNKLDSLILQDLSMNEFSSKITVFEQEISNNVSLTLNEKERILITSSIALYSKDLWTDYTGNNPDYFPWWVVADAAGGVVGWFGIGGPWGAIISGAFFSLFVAKTQGLI